MKRAAIKQIVLGALLSLALYFAIALTITLNHYYLYFLGLLLLEKFVYKSKRTEGLYLIMPVLAGGLFIFDPSASFLGLKFVIGGIGLYCLSRILNRQWVHYSLSIALIACIYFFINPNWQQFYKNRDALSYTQSSEPHTEVSALKPPSVADLNLAVNLDPQKTYILEFWYSKCGHCFDKMDLFNQWAKKYPEYRSNIILVNVALEGESYQHNEAYVKAFGFTSTHTTNSMKEMEQLGVPYYPMQVVVKNNAIVFIGNVATEKFVLKNQILSFLE